MRGYMGYPLWIDDFDDISEVPEEDVRIDDRIVAKLIDANKPAAWYNRRWPVEFDKKKMVKTSRMPLGYAVKMFVYQEAIDRNGEIATQDG